MSKPKHILVIRLSAMGDVAMTVPVLRALLLQYPEVKITVVSRPFFQPFFDGIPNVIFFGVDLNKRHEGFLGLLRLFSDLRKLNIDAVADLHNVLRSKVVRTLFALSGKKVAATENEILKISGGKTQNWIGIAPFAQYESKVYPQNLMQKVIDGLAENSNHKIFLFGGGEKEIQLLNQLQNQHENVIVLAGKLKFKQELEVISNLDIMLSMDSGNAHIAAMLGVKVITLWGATHPYAGFKPFNQPDDFCLTSDRTQYPLLPTSVYGNKKVEGYEEAMRSILPETVIDKIKKELN
ncbi:MAG: glycosyltransferase family 9 protein [Flavobacteriaceae bacterium]|nr:glycosyltransferase family 9 protein [Flavobacteriaceae bacterium]